MQPTSPAKVAVVTGSGRRRVGNAVAVALAERGSVRLPLRGVQAWRTLPSEAARRRS